MGRGGGGCVGGSKPLGGSDNPGPVWRGSCTPPRLIIGISGKIVRSLIYPCPDHPEAVLLFAWGRNLEWGAVEARASAEARFCWWGWADETTCKAGSRRPHPSACGLVGEKDMAGPIPFSIWGGETDFVT